jgi:predicted ArsR family transcriptional regulator
VSRRTSRARASTSTRSAPVTAPGVDGLAARLAADGFAPTVRQRGSRTEIVLGVCPFVDAAEANPELVCGLHLGLAEAAGVTAGVQIDGLSPRPPRRAGCRLAVRA